MTKLVVKDVALLLPSRLAERIGLNEAMILQQIHYWISAETNKHCKDNHTWVYNSYTQWKNQFPFWSEITIRRTIKSLEKQGLILSKISSKSYNKVKWYSVNYDRLIDMGFCLNESEISNKQEYNYFQNDRSKRSDEVINLIRSNKVTKNTTENNNSLSFTEVDKKQITDQIEENSPERELIKIWNEEFIQEGRKEVKLTTERTKALKQAYTEAFDRNISKWRDFCAMIRSSKFLIGEITNFKASFDWCIKPQNIQKILEGNYKLNDRVVHKSKTLEQCKEVELSKNLDPTWSKALDSLKVSMGIDTVKSWIEKLNYQRVGEKSVKLTAPTRFIERTVIEQYKDKVLDAFCSIGFSIEELIIDHAYLH